VTSGLHTLAKVPNLCPPMPINKLLIQVYVNDLVNINEESASKNMSMSNLIMMMIAFITIKSSLVPLIEGLCAQIYFRFEISVVCSHLLLFFFVKEKTC